MEAPPPAPLSCRCKVGRCPEEGCMRCPRCECECDGRTVAEKLRKRSRRRSKAAFAEAIAKRPRTSRELRPHAPVAYAVPSDSNASDESDESDERERKPRRHWNFMSAFGFSDDRVRHIRRHIGAAELRADPDTWDAARLDCGNYERKARAAVMDLYTEALQLVATEVCGSEAAAASVGFFKKQVIAGTEDRSAVNKLVADTRQEVLRPLGRLIAASKKGSVERRVMRAILCQTFSTREVDELAEAVPGFSVSRSIFTKSRRDYDILVEDGVFSEDRTTRTRFDPAVVDRAIDALLSRQNVSHVSFGEKRVNVDGAVVSFPAIRRKRSVRDIYDDYKATHGDDVVSRTTFYRLVRLVTCGDMTSRRDTDALTGALLEDSISRLLRIVSDHLPSESRELAEKLALIKDWLQYGFCDPRGPSAGCPQHDSLFRLASGSEGSEARAVTCVPCLQMHAFQAYIKQSLGDQHGVVDDCFQKLDMYTAYQLRVLNQQTAIDKLFENMKARCLETGTSKEALVVINFKRTVAPMYYRAKPGADADGAGMSWHSAMVRFWSTEESAEAQAVESTVYFDHVAAHTADKTVVVALLEAVIVSIKRDLPHITSIAVQSNNASYYQSSLLAVLLPILGAANSLPVSRFIHTESVDGKSPLDVHFARATKKIVAWIQHGNNCTAPSHLVEALASDGGLPNSIAQLVEYDNQQLEQLVDQAVLTASSFSKLSGAANDILYAFPELEQELVTFSSSPSYSLRSFSYSDVGDGIEIEVRPQEDRCVTANASTEVEVIAEEGDDEDCRDELVGLPDEEGAAEDSELDDDDSEVDHEAVFPSVAIGRMTRVKIVTIAQVRLRDRRWPPTSSTTLLPVSRPGSQPRVEEEKDIFAYSKRLLHERFVSGRLAAFSSSTLLDQMARLCDGIYVRAGGPKLVVHAGSARRPVHANPYGAKYMAAFQADIQQIINPSGQLRRWGKQAPLRVLEVLQYKYPGRYDLPGESDIRAEIAGRRSSVVHVPPSKEYRRKQRQLVTAPQSGEGDEASGAKRRNPLAAEYSVFLESLVAGTPGVKPLEALQAFREKFPDATDVPDDKVKAKVSNLKTKAQLQRRLHPQQVRDTDDCG